MLRVLSVFGPARRIRGASSPKEKYPALIENAFMTGHKDMWRRVELFGIRGDYARPDARNRR